MAVYKHTGSPHYHYDFQFKGIRHHGSTGCRTKADARKFENRLRTEVALPTRKRPVITVDEACGLYSDKVAELPSWPTMRYMLAALVKGLGPGMTLSEVTQRDLHRFFNERREGRSDASINREIENARAVWRHADSLRYEIEEMPNWRALRLKTNTQPPRELSFEEEDRLHEHLRHDLGDVISFLLKSGWRRNEVLKLKWTDCNLDRRQATTRIKGGEVVSRALSGELVALIERQPTESDFVFTYECQKSRGDRRKGQRYPISPTALRKPFAAALKLAKIENCRLHDLRHTRATRIIRSTGSLAAAKEALKHRSMSTTLRYAHVMDDDLRKALEMSDHRNSPEQRKTDASKTQV